MARQKCTATKANGEPCQSFAVREGLCQAHNPDRSTAHKNASRRGGENRSAQRRAARLWADKGRQIRDEDLVPILKACVFDVRLGTLEPAMTSAIATLAKTAMQLKADAELEARLQRLEQAAGIHQGTGIRRVK
jgi:hypothetical protein